MPDHLRATHRVCFCALATVLGLAAAPAALGDDGSPVPAAPPVVAPAPPTVPGTTETPVVPSVPAPIPPVVPPDPAAPAAGEVAPAPAQTQAQQGSTATPVAQPAAPADSGNTTADNSSGITNAPAEKPAKTIVWNWVWNCKDDPTPAVIPAVPADVTTIIINWKWECADVTPPPLDVASVIPCVDCNINISVRVASPGDNAAVSQSTTVDVAAVAAPVAEAAQAATQTVVPPQPPVVSPPALPHAAQPLASAAATPAPAAPVAPTPPAPPAPPDVVQPAPPTPEPAPEPYADEAPRHGAPDLAHAPPASKPHAAAPAKPAPVQHVTTTVVRSISVVHVRTVIHERNVRPAGHAPLRFPPPSTPSAPAVFTAATGETHGTGGFTPVALAAGGIGTFLLMFLAYAAPGLQTVRPRPAQANPHPPG